MAVILPQKSTVNGLSIRPVMSIKANIIYLKSVHSGFSVSYGRKFTTERESLIATLALGYADGYPRYLSGKGASHCERKFMHLLWGTFVWISV